MPPDERRARVLLLRFGEILYLTLTVFSFYLLFISRSGEAYTVWQVLHPAFMPVIFAAASLLVMILLTSEKTAYKLLCVILFSILLHSFFSIVFPAGDLSGQQSVLGRVRLVFDNAVLHGLTGWPNRNIQVAIYQLFMGANLQAALSVIFARMLGIDIFYVHLSFIPILWGTFTPVAVFLATKTIGGSDKASVLSSLLISVFPYATYFGAISVPNSLGFIFFFYALYFMLRHLSRNDSGTTNWIVIFSFFSFLSHYLTGIMSFSLLFLTLTLKTYEGENKPSSTDSRILLVASFIVCLSLLPFSFIYLNFLGSASNAVFTLDKFYQLPLQEVIGLFFLGELVYGFDLKTILLVIVGPLLGLLSMIYQLYRLKRNPDDKSRVRIYFLFIAFLIALVDYRILKLFMSGLPINEERLWVFSNFIAAPFVALAIFAIVSSLKTLLKAKSPSPMSFTGLKNLSKGNAFRVLSLLLTTNILIPALLGGWITLSLSAAYPHVASLQTTWYELEAARSIEDNTPEKYVVIGDTWTVYAGEVIVGINNPRAYYFAEFGKIGHQLFVNMTQDPSSKWMLQAMNMTGTDTTTAYFIITEPRLGSEEFNNVFSKAKESDLQVYGPAEGFGNGKLYVFSCRKD